MQKRQFVDEILWMQLMIALLVIAGHTISLRPYDTSQVPGIFGSFFRFLTHFRMPAFVFISGFLMIYVDKAHHEPISLKTDCSTLAQFIRRRAIRLLSPYITMMLLCLIVKSIAGTYYELEAPVDLSFSTFGLLLTTPNNHICGIYWFLPFIFILGCCGKCYDTLARRLHKRLLAWGLLTVVAFYIYLVTPFWALTCFLCESQLVHYCWAFALGAFVCCAMRNRLIRPKTPIALLMAVIFLGFAITIYNLTANFFIKEVVITISMLSTIYLIAVVICRYDKTSRTVFWKDTYMYYILGIFCQYSANSLLKQHELPIETYIFFMLIAGLGGALLGIKTINAIESRLGSYPISTVLGRRIRKIETARGVQATATE